MKKEKRKTLFEDLRVLSNYLYFLKREKRPRSSHKMQEVKKLARVIFPETKEFGLASLRTDELIVLKKITKSIIKQFEFNKTLFK